MEEKEIRKFLRSCGFKKRGGINYLLINKDRMETNDIINSESMYRWKSLSLYSKEELIEIVNEMWSMLREQWERHQKDLDSISFAL